MHRLSSKSAIFRFRVAALLLWINSLIFLASIAALVNAIIERSHRHVLLAIILMGSLLILALVQWLVALQTKCPLCITPVLAAKNCAKNKKARKIFGSYRLRVAASLLLRNYFRCPYCSEPTELVVRDRHSRSRRHREH